jgi:hypothetical protein
MIPVPPWVDPTLATLGGEDVALDMDDILVYQDSDDDCSDTVLLRPSVHGM